MDGSLTVAVEIDISALRWKILNSNLLEEECDYLIELIDADTEIETEH